MDIAFYGSSDFSVRILQKLFEFHKEGNVNLKYVVSQPAKPFGRKKELKNNPVVQYCIENNILVLTPVKIRELFEGIEVSKKLEVKSKNVIGDNLLSSDISFVAAYGKILPKKLLDTAKYGFLNFHGSLLPKYRGAAPVQFTILNQDKDSAGVTIIKMNEGMDTGEILVSEKLKVKSEKFEEMNSGDLMDELADLSAYILDRDFELIFNPDKWILTKQNHDEATYCYVSDMVKENFGVRFEDTVLKAHGKIMAGNPGPVARCQLIVKSEELIVDVYQSRLSRIEEIETASFFGFFIYDNKLLLRFSDGLLEILSLKPLGKRELNAKEFINGYNRFCTFL